jgi:uncharacterized protein (DUF885 family)
MKSKFSRIISIFLIVLASALLFSACSSANPEIDTEQSNITNDDEQEPEDFDPSPPDQAPKDDAIERILDDLSGLPIDQFFEDSFHQMSLRNPENLVELGLGQSLGMEVTLNDLSREYQLATKQLEAGILEILEGYDIEKLPSEQQISHQVYLWYLEDIVQGHPFSEYHYVASHMISNGIHNQTFQFFTETHPVNNLEQAENYIIRLNLVDEKFEQLVDALKIRADMGIIPPQFSIDWALYGLRGQTSSIAASHPYFNAFREKLNNIDNLSNDDREELLAQAEAAIETSVLPAEAALIEELEHQRNLASEDDMGLWQFDGGEEFYAYLLRHYTTTELTADEIHELGLRELDRIHEEMRTVFDQLGYPQDEDLVTLFERAAKEGGIVQSGDTIETFEQIISDTYLLLDQAFEVTPRAEVIVKGDAFGGYYVPGSLDGSRPGAFYAGISGGGEPYFQMRSLAYHETIPGHHFQIALAREMSLPTFRNMISLTGYVEGWALYAERLADDLGWYADDPYSDLGRLQYEALRAARLVVDTGLHTKQWSFDQAVEFFMKNVGWGRQRSEYQIARYIVLPGQATAYMVGMLQILDLCQQAMDQLGEDFDLAEFHTVILEGGAMPLSMLAEKVEVYIAEKLAE